MIKLAKWIGPLVLAGTSTSCLSTSLHEWATEEAPRSEVIGFVDAHGNGDLLLVKLDGEPSHPDGMYELAIFANEDVQFSVDEVAPKRVRDVRASELQRARAASSSVARLDCTEECDPSGWWPVDGYELADGVLRRIETPPRRYFVCVEAQIEPSIEIGSITKLRVHAPDSSDGPGKLRGIAYLPPARRSTARVVTAVAAAPIAVAVDVVTFPVQLIATVGLVAWMSHHPPFFFSDRRVFALQVVPYRRWFRRGDPEIPVLMGLSAAALSHPESLVVVSFTPVSRSFATGLFRMLRLEHLERDSAQKSKTDALTAQR